MHNLTTLFQLGVFTPVLIAVMLMALTAGTIGIFVKLIRDPFTAISLAFMIGAFIFFLTSNNGAIFV